MSLELSLAIIIAYFWVVGFICGKAWQKWIQRKRIRKFIEILIEQEKEDMEKEIGGNK